MNKLIWILVAAVSLFSTCKSQQITGRYVYEEDFVYHRVDLKADSSFVYYIDTGLAMADSTVGRWRHSDNFLYLVSDKTDYPCQVHEEIDSKMNGYLIRLGNIEGAITLGDYICLIGNHDVKYRVDELGEIMITFQQNSINEIFIYSIWRQFKYVVVNEKANIFNIRYNSEESGSFYFENQRFLVRKNKIKIHEDAFFLKLTARKRS